MREAPSSPLLATSSGPASPCLPPERAGKSAFARIFDAAALAFLPWLARVFGYTFRVGTEAKLAGDAHAVLATVWKAKGVTQDPEMAWYAERYNRATTWIVCYHRGRPAGVMGLLDMRIASSSLDYGGQLPPADLPLDVTREIGRLGILPEHRGGAHLVMVGLLFQMLEWARAHGMVYLFSGSTPALFRVYQRYNETARLVTAPPDPTPNPARDRYCAPLRAYGREGVVYTFEVAGSTPFAVLQRALAGGLQRGLAARRSAPALSRGTANA